MVIGHSQKTNRRFNRGTMIAGVVLLILCVVYLAVGALIVGYFQHLPAHSSAFPVRLVFFCLVLSGLVLVSGSTCILIVGITSRLNAPTVFLLLMILTSSLCLHPFCKTLIYLMANFRDITLGGR